MSKECTEKDEWETPVRLFSVLNEIFCFNSDMAANERNHKCASWYGPGNPDQDRTDALSVEWPVASVNWCNPPFSLLWEFCKKAFDELKRNNCMTVLLMPANRFEQGGFHDFVAGTADLCFIRRRVKFAPPNGRRSTSPPFGCVLAMYGTCYELGCGGKSYSTLSL